MISCTYLMLPTNCLGIYLSVNHCTVLFSTFTKDSVFWVVCYYGTRYTISPYAKQPGKSESFVTTVVCCNEGLNTIWIGFLFHKNNKNQIALSNDTVVRIKYTSQGNSLNLIILGEWRPGSDYLKWMLHSAKSKGTKESESHSNVNGNLERSDFFNGVENNFNLH